MKLVVAIIQSTFLFFSFPANAETLIQVVVDHSGVLHDERDPAGKSSFNAYLRSFLEQVARTYRRERDEVQIRLISAVDPPSNIWSGSAADLYRGGGAIGEGVRALVDRAPNGCNNLPDALKEVLVNKNIRGAPHNIVHIITSGVHSGPACQSLTQEQYIHIVSTTDVQLVRQIQVVAAQFDQLSVHFLTAAQRRGFYDELDPASTNVHLFAQGEEPRF